MWPGAELVSARSIERTLQRQREALALLAGTACAGAARAAAGPRSAPGVRGGGRRRRDRRRLGGPRYERDRGDRSADALIEEGFRYERRSDAVSRAVAERVARLESDPQAPQPRRRPPSPRRARPHAAQPGDRSGARPSPVLRGLGEHCDVVERIAASFERGACDPRAIIQVERLLTMPPAATLPGEDDPAELGHRLHRIARLLEAGP